MTLITLELIIATGGLVLGFVYWSLDQFGKMERRIDRVEQEVSLLRLEHQKDREAAEIRIAASLDRLSEISVDNSQEIKNLIRQVQALHKRLDICDIRGNSNEYSNS